MKTLLVRVGLWLAKAGGWAPDPPCLRAHWPTFDPALVVRASALVREQTEMNPAGSGENKRHLVYSHLVKEFPSVSRRDISLVIERVL